MHVYVHGMCMTHSSSSHMHTCTCMYAPRLQAADLSAHELGDLLSEIRQADLKLQEMRLAQGADCREGDTLELVERYGKYLQQFGYDLELALISLERFTAEVGVPPPPAAAATPAATATAATTAATAPAAEGSVARPKGILRGVPKGISRTRSITRSGMRSGMRSERSERSVPLEALPQGSRFRRSTYTRHAQSILCIACAWYVHRMRTACA